VGDGPCRGRLERIASEIGLGQEDLEFKGEAADVIPYLARASMLVLPSQHEGFPNVILEAMAARLPVISTAAGDASRLVEDGFNGFIVPFGSDQTLASRMLQLFEDTELAGEMGERGRRRVQSSFSLEGLSQRLLAAYSLVLGGEPA
jgi:glycosyltransferase involved in cell wall biosynthesis